MTTRTVHVDFYDLPLFGHALTASGTAEVEYSTLYSGFVTRSVTVDREFVPILAPRPTAAFPSPEFRAALEAEIIRQFDARCVEDVEQAIRDEGVERGQRRAA